MLTHLGNRAAQHSRMLLGLAGCLWFFGSAAPAEAQAPAARSGEVVPRDVREVYDRGLQYLAAAQNENGDWTGGGQEGPGVTGLALMVFLASGEDPNFGLYSNHVRRALRSIIAARCPAKRRPASSP
jgi:hypothetical protein